MASADGEHQGGFCDALRRPRLPSEEYRYQRGSNSSHLVRCLIRLREQTIDDGLTTGMLDGFRRRALRRPSKKRVDMLDDIVRGHEAPGLTREQRPGFREAYAEERRRSPKLWQLVKPRPWNHSSCVAYPRAQCFQSEMLKSRWGTLASTRFSSSNPCTFTVASVRPHRSCLEGSLRTYILGANCNHPAASPRSPLQDSSPLLRLPMPSRAFRTA